MAAPTGGLRAPGPDLAEGGGDGALGVGQRGAHPLLQGQRQHPVGYQLGAALGSTTGAEEPAPDPPCGQQLLAPGPFGDLRRSIEQHHRYRLQGPVGPADL